MLLSLPKSVTIAGIEIEIVQDDSIFETHNLLGRASYQDQRIYIASGVVPEDTVMQVLYHELIHWIFNIFGRTASQHDEELIDFLSATLWQAEKTRVPIDLNEYPGQMIRKD